MSSSVTRDKQLSVKSDCSNKMCVVTGQRHADGSGEWHHEVDRPSGPDSASCSADLQHPCLGCRQRQRQVSICRTRPYNAFNYRLKLGLHRARFKFWNETLEPLKPVLFKMNCRAAIFAVSALWWILALKCSFSSSYWIFFITSVWTSCFICCVWMLLLSPYWAII